MYRGGQLVGWMLDRVQITGLPIKKLRSHRQGFGTLTINHLKRKYEGEGAYTHSSIAYSDQGIRTRRIIQISNR